MGTLAPMAPSARVGLQLAVAALVIVLCQAEWAKRAADAVGDEASAGAGAAAATATTTSATKKMPLAYTSFHSEHSEKVVKKKKGQFKAYIAKEALKSFSKPFVYMSGSALKSKITAEGLKQVADANAPAPESESIEEDPSAEEKEAELKESQERATKAREAVKAAKESLRAAMASGDKAKYWAAKSKVADANIALTDAIPGAKAVASADDAAAEEAMRKKLLADISKKMAATVAAEDEADDEPPSDWKQRLTRTVGRITLNISTAWVAENRKSFEDGFVADVARALNVTADQIEDTHLKGKTVEFVVADGDVGALMAGKSVFDFKFEDVAEAVGPNATVNATLVSSGIQWCHAHGKFINATKSCRCDVGFAGIDCSIDSCNGHGNWDFEKGKCECENGWLVTTMCKKHACSEHGRFTSGVCKCNYWWLGSDCSQPRPEPTCMGRGVYNRTTLKCQCHTGSWPSFDMQRCEKLDPKQHPLCNKRGHLINNETACNCTKPGWTGQRCGIPPCSGHGIYFKSSCICDKGFGGKQCDNSYCNGHGRLKDALNPKSGCECDVNWSGPDEKQCSEHVCSEKGALLRDGKTCDCRGGWTGPKCSIAVCENGKWEGGDAGGCKCEPGWKGVNCTENSLVNGGASASVEATPLTSATTTTTDSSALSADAGDSIASPPLTEAEQEEAAEKAQSAAKQPTVPTVPWKRHR